MKKILKLLSIAMIFVVVSSTAYSALAYSNGSVIGKACYTDIKASINGYDINSYNVDGYTYVVAEDLRNYGFNVVWDSSSRTLAISRGSSTYPASEYKAPFITQDLVGKKSHNLLYTDIKTYVNNSWVQSYNINGRTIIRFESLNVFGAVTWTPESKDISLEIPYFSTKPVDMNKFYAKEDYIESSRMVEYAAEYIFETAMSQYELNEGTAYVYEDWDSLLNAIYSYLETILPASDFEKLKKDEIRWAKEKEAAINAEYAAWGGGSAGPMAANSVGISYTQDRCYYLISLIRP